jgi:hypothetical protein
MLVVAFSFVVAILSWKFIETPFRKRTWLSSRPQIFGFACAVSVAAFVCGFMVFHAQGFPWRLPKKVLEFANAENEGAFGNQISLEQAKEGKFVELGGRSAEEPVFVIIWGDSHAMHITQAIDDLCREYSKRGMEATHSLTPPARHYVCTGYWSLKQNAPAYTEAVIEYVAKARVKNVILSSGWSGYGDTAGFKTGLLDTVRALLNAGAKVYLVKDVPFHSFNVPRMVATTELQGRDITKLGLPVAEHRKRNENMAKTFEEASQLGATVLDPADFFLNSDGLYGVVKDGKVLYMDEGHLTATGARYLKPLFDPIFHASGR